MLGVYRPHAPQVRPGKPSVAVEELAALVPDLDVRLVDVAKLYGDLTAVDHINLEVANGEFFSLLGPSGCGKTTTLRMIGGFEQPTSGLIELQGQDVTWLPPYRRNVNTVFQSYALFENLDVFENVAFGLKRKKVAKSEIRTRVDEALELVQLPSRSDAKPRELSGGQKQRVALARALVNRPSVLLLDEPLGALDLKLRRQMQGELKQIQREVGITFVYVTHDQEEALSMSDRIAVMDAGRVIQCGPPEEVYEHPTESFVADFIGISNLLDGTVAEGGQVRLAGGNSVPAPLKEGLAVGDAVKLAVRPEKITIDEIEDGMVVLEGVVEQRVYLGMTTQVTVSLGGDARLVALDKQSYRASAEDRWEPGMRIKLGWHAEHALVLS